MGCVCWGGGVRDLGRVRAESQAAMERGQICLPAVVWCVLRAAAPSTMYNQ